MYDLPENGFFASRLSRSFEIFEPDTDRSATCDFLLVTHSNCGPISYRFWDKPILFAIHKIFHTHEAFRRRGSSGIL